MNKKTLITLAVPAVLVFSLLMAILVLRKPEPIVVGYLGTLSGKYALMGVPARDGAVLAVNEINASGGIRGRSIELYIMDDEGIPEKAAEGVEELAEKGVRFLVGPFLSASGVAALPAINKHRILTLSPTTSSEHLMDKNDYYLNLSPPSRQFGMSLSGRIQKLGFKKVAIISDGRNDAFCSPFISGLNQGLEIHDSIVVESEITYEQRDGILRETAERAMALSPECVVLCTSGLDGGILSQHLKNHDQGIRIFSSAWGMSDALINYGGKAIEGMEIFSAVKLTDSSDRYKDFEESYRKQFAENPVMVSILNYEAMMILAESIEESAGISPEVVQSVITSMGGHDGLQQRITFDNEGDAHRKLTLHLVKSGMFVPQITGK